MSNPSRVTITANAEAIAYLAAWQQHRDMIAGRISIEWDGSDAVSPLRTAFKAAARSAASILSANQIPAFLTPDQLIRAVEQQSITRPVAQQAVATLEATNSVLPADCQPNDQQVADILCGILCADPYVSRGIKGVRATNAPEAGPQRLSPLELIEQAENPITVEWPLDAPRPVTPPATDEEASS